MKKEILRAMIREALRNVNEAEGDEETPTPAATSPTESPSDQAHKLNLTYSGHTYWKDASGKTVAQTIGDRLVKIADDDPYSPNPVPLRGPRSNKFGKKDMQQMTGTDFSDAQPLSSLKSAKGKAASSTGGAGTHAGYVPTPGFNVSSATTTPNDIEAAVEGAQALEARLGRGGAIKKIEGTMQSAAQRLKLLANHNSNSSEKRLNDLSKLDKAVRHQKMMLRALKGEPVGEPGTADVPTHEDGTPFEVNVNGKHGVVDMVDEENSAMYVTFDDNTWAKIPFGQSREKAAVAPGTKFGENTMTESDASDQAAQLGLTYIGFGRYIDQTGKVVAQSVNGQLTRVDPQEVEDGELGLDPQMDKDLLKMFKSAGTWNYVPKGQNHIAPHWNKGMKMHDEDIAFDANGEKTVQKLLAMIKDPARLVRWLIKTFKKETLNGKQRILQYLGILNKMGVLDKGDAQAAQNPGAVQTEPVAQAATAEKPTRSTPSLFDM